MPLTLRVTGCFACTPEFPGGRPRTLSQDDPVRFRNSAGIALGCVETRSDEACHEGMPVFRDVGVIRSFYISVWSK